MSLSLKRSPQSSHYCVPAALALITGKHVDEICAILVEKYLGDQPIEDVFIGPALDLLKECGFTVLPDCKDSFGGKLSGIKNISARLGQTFFVHFHGHVGVVHDGKYYDNMIPEGDWQFPRRRLESA